MGKRYRQRKKEADRDRGEECACLLGRKRAVRERKKGLKKVGVAFLRQKNEICSGRLSSIDG